MRRLLAFVALVSTVCSMACDDSDGERGVSDADAAQCRELASEDSPLGDLASKFCIASFKATYDWRVVHGDDPSDFPVPTRVTLYKLGLQRLRIDANVEGVADAKLVVIVSQSDKEDEEQFVVCSFGGALPGNSFAEDQCFREGGETEFGPAFVYGITSSLFGGGSLGGDVAPHEARTVAGHQGTCFVNTDVQEVEAEFCYSESGLPLYSRIGENVIEATEVTGDIDEDDFEPPLALTDIPTPSEPFPEQTRVPLDESIEIRIAANADFTQDQLSAAIDVLRDRVERADPVCLGSEESVDATRPEAFRGRECAFLEEGAVVLRFELSGYRDRWSDEELTAWLTATGDPDAVHVRLCEPMLDEQGRVATAGVGDVTYAPGTCDPDTSGASVSYVDRLEADPDTIIWTPATGELNGEPVAITDEHFVGAYFDHPVNFTHRFFYQPSPEGEQILNSIWARLGPTAERRIRTNDDYYSLAVFIDGAPMRDLDGEIALQDIYRTEWALQGITNLSVDEARRVTQLIVGPDLQIQLEVLSITRSPAPPD